MVVGADKAGGRAGLAGFNGSHQRLIQLLRRIAPASRAELAALCGLTPAAVSMLVQELLACGLIEEGARRKGGRGAPQIDLTLCQNAGYALGIHADHSSIDLTLVDFRGDIRRELRLRDRFAHFDDVVAAIAAGAGQMLAGMELTPSALMGAGFALATRFRDGNVVLNLADDIKSWRGNDVTARLSQALGCPVIVENDANAAAMGELSMGGSKTYERFFYLYLSNGIGGALVMEGKLFRGWRGNAGEIGALRPRGISRPSFDDLEAWLVQAGCGPLPEGRDTDEWEAVLESLPLATQEWLNRAAPEAARLAFAVMAVLDPPAIYIGGILPRSLRRRMIEWMDFSEAGLFDGATLMQTDILLPERTARSSASVGAAAMILHNIG